MFNTIDVTASGVGVAARMLSSTIAAAAAAAAGKHRVAAATEASMDWGCI